MSCVPGVRLAIEHDPGAKIGLEEGVIFRFENVESQRVAAFFDGVDDFLEFGEHGLAEQSAANVIDLSIDQVGAHRLILRMFEKVVGEQLFIEGARDLGEIEVFVEANTFDLGDLFFREHVVEVFRDVVMLGEFALADHHVDDGLPDRGVDLRFPANHRHVFYEIGVQAGVFGDELAGACRVRVEDGVGFGDGILEGGNLGFVLQGPGAGGPPGADGLVGHRFEGVPGERAAVAGARYLGGVGVQGDDGVDLA